MSMILGDAKLCSKCRKYKPFSEYHKAKGRTHGIASQCKDCVNAKSRKYRNPEDRFWKFFLSHTTRAENGCLIWTGRISHDNGRGVPLYRWEGKANASARRLVYRLSVGEVPDDKVVFAACGTPLCVNRLHLKLGGEAEIAVLRSHGGSGPNAPRGERHGTHTHPESVPRGERRWNAKLTENDVRIIRQDAAEGTPNRALADRFGIKIRVIRDVIRRRTWKHVSAD